MDWREHAGSEPHRSPTLPSWPVEACSLSLSLSHSGSSCPSRAHSTSRTGCWCACPGRTQQHNWLLVGLPWLHPAPTSALTGVPAPDAPSSTTGCWWVCPGSTTLSHTGCWCTCPGLHPAPHTLTLLNTTHGGRCNSSSRGRSSRGGCTTSGRLVLCSLLLCSCWVHGAVPLDRYAAAVVVLAVQYRTTPTLLL